MHNFSLFTFPHTPHPTPYTDGGPTPYTDGGPTPYTPKAPTPLHRWRPYTLDDFANGDIRANNQTIR